MTKDKAKERIRKLAEIVTVVKKPYGEDLFIRLENGELLEVVLLEQAKNRYHILTPLTIGHL